jgi:hypothetical protein
VPRQAFFADVPFGSLIAPLTVRTVRQCSRARATVALIDRGLCLSSLTMVAVAEVTAANLALPVTLLRATVNRSLCPGNWQCRGRQRR